MNRTSPLNARTMKILQACGFALLLVIYPLMIFFFSRSGDTIPIIESQLSFSGVFLKAQYAAIMDGGNIGYYRLGQVLDYGFMLAYGILMATISGRTGLAMESNPKGQKFAQIGAIVGIMAPIFDALENLFILLTLSDPIGFPNSWAVMHSVFALIKWILMGFWTVLMLLTVAIRIAHAKKNKVE